MYSAVLSEIAPADISFAIKIEKVKIAIAGLLDVEERMRAAGSYTFPDTEALFLTTNFPNLEVTLLSKRDLSGLQALDCMSFWRSFHESYPNAQSLIALSDVGFSKGRKEAILYLESGSGCLSGVGMLIQLQLKRDRWVIVGKEQLWIS